ncbi:dihydrodipicolinate synthase family protein [Microterricola viridarii]|uniref:4-hydroxy-tetrahydrodipicolinate synthase n=1 Tax=Microterricola viridarii TaxID=412690 RepID=A0A1H1TJ61_9MICO|nr:4-hydroxy-tetrahydrodipicolinate synthase [Microterricola viridarii]
MSTPLSTTETTTDNAPTTALSGIVPPVITPRDAAGNIDTASLARVVDHLIDGGVSGLFILGSSSEVPYLTNAERDVVADATVAAVRGRVPVLAGVNEQTTNRVIDEGRRLLDRGIEGFVVTTPYYAISDDNEVASHFRSVKEALALPLYAYDVPVRTHRKLSPAFLAALAEDGVIAGVKDSSGDDVSFRQLLLATAHLADFRVFTGHEVVVDGALLGGAHGAVPGLANVDPAGYVRMHEAARAGDWASVRAEQDRLARLFEIVFAPTPGRVSGGAAGLGAFKTALALLGVIDNNRMSEPMLSLNAEETARIRGILVSTGLLAE